MLGRFGIEEARLEQYVHKGCLEKLTLPDDNSESNGRRGSLKQKLQRQHSRARTNLPNPNPKP